VDPSVAAVPQLVICDNDEVAITERHQFSGLLKEHLATSQNKMKIHADTKHNPKQFQTGEQVLLKLQPYAQSSVVNMPCPKLALKYFGPYQVLDRIGQIAYRIQLLVGSQVHLVFHVSQLKPFTPDFTLVFSELPSAPQLDLLELELELILDRLLSKKGNAVVTQILIKWTSLPNDLATWEDYEVVKHRYPTAAAWGHAASQGGSDVMTGTVVAHDI
jgi:hypothetical protein